MLFNSFDFLIFFPIVLLIYYAIPDRIKYIWLLVTSYYFYMCWNAKYALLILLSSAITYLSGIAMEKVDRNISSAEKISRYKKIIVAISLVSNLGILFYFKYFNFAVSLLAKVLSYVHITISIPRFDILLPVGISFYTFQALGYTLDVYRGDIYAEKNFLRYALFVSFFPQLVAGPIERSKNLLKQLAVTNKFNYRKAKKGFLLMLWGFFLKIVLADRIAIFVDKVYGDYETYTGWYLVIATILFGVQVYCDFAGYSIIAVGAAKFLGVDLMENFDAPYLSTSVAEFWRKWHISLTSWFKDYLYIPLGGSRRGKLRKYFNKVVVFLVSGLWHGASISYVVWGGLNGCYQVIGEILMPLREKVWHICNIQPESKGHRLLQMGCTYILIDFTWIFFRANSFSEGVAIVKHICRASNPWILFDGGLYQCGLDQRNFQFMLVAIGILLFADICKKKKICIIDSILEEDTWFQWIFVLAAVMIILIFGIYGPSYDAANFIYFQF